MIKSRACARKDILQELQEGFKSSGFIQYTYTKTKIFENLSKNKYCRSFCLKYLAYWTNFANFVQYKQNIGHNHEIYRTFSAQRT